MKAKFGLAICGFLLFSLPLFASVTLTDDFSDLNYTATPTWVVVSGTAPSVAAGNLDIPQNTIVSLSLPGSLDGTKSEVSFDIWHTENLGWEGDYTVQIDFRDYTANAPWGVGYYFHASTTTPGGNSGFHGHSATEASVYGLSGADLGTSGNVVSRLTLSFDPATGITMKQGDTVILTQPNFRNVSKMTEFRFKATSVLDWRIDNVVATYNIDALSRGHEILMQRGLQIQAMIPMCNQLLPDGLDLVTFADSNFTAANIWYYPNPDVYLGSPEDGILWGRVATNTFIQTLDLQPGELAYAYNLVNMQLNDEQDMTDPCELELAKTWFAEMKTKYPWVLFYTNQSGGALTSAQLSNYMSYTEPDMLSMDVYPYHHHSLSEFLRCMKTYRDVALGGYDGTGNKPIPYGVYTQAWLPPADGYTMSESELFLNQFAAWAFGCKFTAAYVYTSDSATGDDTALLFDGYDDSTPTAMFYSHSELNRQARNLGDALVRLLSTDIRIIPGQHMEVGVPVANTLPEGISAWNNAAEPNITSISATNLGTLNNGLRGDLYVGYFKPILKILDGIDYQDDTYFMIVNALNDENGNCTQTKQQVRIDFDFHSSGITSLLRMSRDTGLVERIPLIHNGGSEYYIQITLDGGTGDLFKFDTGVPFVGSKCRAELAGDLNADCYVNFEDFVELASEWLKCTNMADPLCD